VRSLLGPALAAGLLLGCASTPAQDPFYRPTEDVLEVVAALRLHLDDDTYRFPPARDFTGKNVFRASFTRLERLEEIYREKFRAGYMTDVLLFAKARALERIVEYDLAAQHYARVASLESPLRQEAERSRAVNARLAEAHRLAPDPHADPDAALAVFDDRTGRLEGLLPEVEGTHHAFVVREEIERSDRDRADYFDARRRLEPALDVLALQQHQRLVQRHAESKERNRHLVDLADLYASLSRQYIARVPPTSLDFDPATFDEYAFGATRLYEAVSQQDGAVEKIEAGRKLEAFLAFTLQVYDEKLPR
jgi:hypothetical protein